MSRPTSATRNPIAPGAIVADKYVVERKLGEGGLGVVLLALHSELGQRVAIKHLKPEILGSAALVERFRREGQLVAGLRSEHVVRVYDVGVHPVAGPYIVMEYLEGEDLSAVISGGPLPVHVAVDYLLQACDAVGEAHALGIVHRDLKPENLFLTRRAGRPDVVKVLDFGFSKVSSTEGQCTIYGRLTVHGERFGTPMFMSPEQLVSTADVDARSDIWALGVVLFELLTTTLPFDGESAATLAKNIFNAGPKSIRPLREDVPPELEAVIKKCLAKDPSDRYPDVASLVTDLARFRAVVRATTPTAGEFATTERPKVAASRRVRFVGALAAATVAVAASTVGALTTAETSARSALTARAAVMLTARAAAVPARQRADAPSSAAASPVAALAAAARPLRGNDPPSSPPDDWDIRRAR